MGILLLSERVRYMFKRLALAVSLVLTVAGCGTPQPPPPHVQGVLTRYQASTSGGAGSVTLQDQLSLKSYEFTLELDADAQLTDNQLQSYITDRTYTLLYYRGTSGVDARAYRIDPGVIGLVTDLRETSQGVEVTITDSAGKAWDFTYRPVPWSHTNSVEHVREHMEHRSPFLAFYRQEGSVLVAYILDDAP
jgi:hypothetical protein